MEKKLKLSQEIQEDCERIESVLLQGTEIIENTLIRQASQLILKSGGKRLRPILVLVAGLSGKYNLQKLIPAGVAIELLHIASLIHDDILDDSEMRRGSPTASSMIGRFPAISSGDYLFAKSFEILSDLQNDEVIRVMAEAAHALTQGELSQMEMAHHSTQSEIGYLNIARNKTAALFAGACRTGAILAEAEESDVRALGTYGDSLGIAFQIYDDLLDLIGDPSVTGKPVGNDLREGKVTLPIVYALEDSGYNKAITTVIEGERVDDGSVAQAIKTITEKTQAIDKAKEEAGRYLRLAVKSVQGLGNEQAKENLSVISDYVTSQLK